MDRRRSCDEIEIGFDATLELIQCSFNVTMKHKINHGDLSPAFDFWFHLKLTVVKIILEHFLLFISKTLREMISEKTNDWIFILLSEIYMNHKKILYTTSHQNMGR